MMGRQETGEALFYEFRLEDHVPADHSLRKIDRLLDLTELRAGLCDLYSHTGRPSVDPELMIRCCHVNSPNLQVGKLFVDQAACAADFHASNASSRW